MKDSEENDKFSYKDITNRKDYISLFDNYEGNKENVFKQILDIRKFEIEMYWKRSAFFFTVIGSVIAGYFLTFSKTVENENTPKILFSLANLGLIFSICWYFVNRGSKFWQVNWEKHMDTIEDDIIGPLYKTTISKSYYRKRFHYLLAPYPFSVSKVNQVLNLVLIFFWFLILYDFSTTHLYFNLSEGKNWISFYSISLYITITAIFSLFAFAQTEIKNIFRKREKSETVINFEKRGLR